MVGSDGLTEEAGAIISGDCVAYMGIPMSPELQAFLEECKRQMSSPFHLKLILQPIQKLFASGKKPPRPHLRGGTLVTIKLRF